MATIYLAMNGYCFSLFISLAEKSSPKHYNSLSPVEQNFCKRWMGLPSVNFSYDISLHFYQITLETKSERLRDTVMQLSLPWLYFLPIISCWLLTYNGCGYKYAKWKYPHSRFSLWFFIAPFYLPSEETEGEKWRGFCVSLLSLIPITRELFCKISSIFP